MADSIVKAFRFRIYPTKAQETRLEHVLDLCRELYNAALEERRDAYRCAGESITYRGQANQLAAIKELRPDLADVHSQVLQDVLRRVDRAFKNFFRRIKAGASEPGYPRFKSRDRYDSFTFPQSGFAFTNGKLKLSKIGEIKIRLHRPIEGEIKTLTVKRDGDKWYVSFSVECVPRRLHPSTETIGVDVGLETFARLSDNTPIENPRFFRTEESELARAQRKLDAAPKGTPERRKRKRIVKRVHARIANRRKNFAHQEARKLVNRFGKICVEDLKVKRMVKNHCLAKSLSDAAWSLFFGLLCVKAAEAGREVIKVNPAYTSQDCAMCGHRVKKELSDRWHDCEVCGFSTHRDHNAALNILRLGLQSGRHQSEEAPPFKGGE